MCMLSRWSSKKSASPPVAGVAGAAEAAGGAEGPVDATPPVAGVTHIRGGTICGACCCGGRPCMCMLSRWSSNKSASPPVAGVKGWVPLISHLSVGGWCTPPWQRRQGPAKELLLQLQRLMLPHHCGWQSFLSGLSSQRIPRRGGGCGGSSTTCASAGPCAYTGACFPVFDVAQ